MSSTSSVCDDDSHENSADCGAAVCDDFVVVNSRTLAPSLPLSSAVTEADKNVDKLLKFVADNDVEMVRRARNAHAVSGFFNANQYQKLVLGFFSDAGRAVTKMDVLRDSFNHLGSI